MSAVVGFAVGAGVVGVVAWLIVRAFLRQRDERELWQTRAGESAREAIDLRGQLKRADDEKARLRLVCKAEVAARVRAEDKLDEVARQDPALAGRLLADELRAEDPGSVSGGDRLRPGAAPAPSGRSLRGR